MPLVVAIASILNTFTLVWLLTYITDVSIIVQFLIALVGLGVAIDYALLMIFRFRDELREGEDVETALVETMTHAGRSVIVSGSTVAVGLLSMLVLPLPFIRSIGIGGMLIPAVSVLAAITLLPALLSVLGTRINSVRLLPKRFVDRGHPEDGLVGPLGAVRHAPAGAGRGRRARDRRRARLLRLAAEPERGAGEGLPRQGDAIDGRDALADAGISPGVMKPFVVLVENGGDRAPSSAKLRGSPGIAGAAAPPAWRKGGTASSRRSPPPTARRRRRAHDQARPRRARRHRRARSAASRPRTATSSRAVYWNFPYVLGFVVLLTFILLARAFRSLVLPLKAVSSTSSRSARPSGSSSSSSSRATAREAIWGVHATHSIIPWIPLMIFAFLFGLSMDYEVFMLTRMREAYDETGDTRHASRSGSRARASSSRAPRWS